MGCWNFFWFLIDFNIGYLYWGDVGLDVGVFDSLWGLVGMGEFNQARMFGFYGWLYSWGNN